MVARLAKTAWKNGVLVYGFRGLEILSYGEVMYSA